MKLHVSACNGHRQVSTMIKKSLYICVPPDRDDNYNKLQFVHPQKEILMSTLQFGNTFLLVIYIAFCTKS